MSLATYTRQTYPIAAARLLAQREMARRGLTWQRSAEDEALWQACRWDYALFGKTFLAAWCPDEFNQLHLDFYVTLGTRAGSRGHFDATAAPRGHAKTMALCLVTMAHACVYQTETYTIYLTYRYEDAVNKTKDLRDELEHNTDLIRVFGPQMGGTWNHADFTTRNGQRVRAASASTQLRGALSRGQRPSWVILDDAEHAEHVLSMEQREKTWNWLVKEIMHLGSPTTNYTVYGTILHESSMLKRLLTTPGWETHFYQAIETFADPASIPLWQQWRAFFLDLTLPNREAKADAFFETHQDDMLRGSKVLWPGRRPYVELMKSRLREGESSFWQELQGQPLGDERYIFDLDVAAFCTVTPSGVIRAGGIQVPFSEIVEVCAAWDPTPPKKDIAGTDFAACAVIAQDRHGYFYLVDAYIDREVSMDVQIDRVIDLLWKWDISVLGIESNSFASLIPGLIREKIKQRALEEHTTEFNTMIVAITNLKSKVMRIKSLDSLMANHWLQLSRELPAEMLRQFREWIPVDGAGFDDGPDATEMAIRCVRHEYERKDLI